MHKKIALLSLVLLSTSPVLSFRPARRLLYLAQRAVHLNLDHCASELYTSCPLDLPSLKVWINNFDSDSSLADYAFVTKLDEITTVSIPEQQLSEEDKEYLSYLLEERKVPINFIIEKDGLYFAPLFYALFSQHVALTEFLLKQGAYPSLSVFHEVSVVSFALSTKNKELIDVLYKYGATLLSPEEHQKHSEWRKEYPNFF
jgi:hypothetical protein